jgi:hypothetical protein
MKLFAIYHGTRTNDGTSNDCDLYIVAKNATQAIAKWRNYYGVAIDKPERIACFPFDLKGKQGVVKWETLTSSDNF